MGESIVSRNAKKYGLMYLFLIIPHHCISGNLRSLVINLRFVNEIVGFRCNVDNLGMNVVPR